MWNGSFEREMNIASALIWIGIATVLAGMVFILYWLFKFLWLGIVTYWEAL